MELRHLRYFLAVCEEMNFTRAAKNLSVAQPSLTRQVHNLEEELGVQLFDRSKSQVSLTDEGNSFLIDAKRLVALSLESILSVQRFSRGESGRLNLGYLFKFNFDLLPSTLTKFYKNCPDVAVNLFDMSPAEQLGALETRKIDLGFVGLRPPTHVKQASALTWECVARHEIVVVLPEKHALANKDRVLIKDLKNFFFVAMAEETHPGSRAWLSSLCEDADFTPRILQDVELESGIMTFVTEGLGVTLAREQIKNLPHEGVVFRPLETTKKVEYWIAWHPENNSKVLRQYIEIVKKESAAWA